MADLPTLDFSQFYLGSQDEKKQLGREIVQSFKDHGFVKLINPGIKDETVDASLAWVGTLSSIEFIRAVRSNQISTVQQILPTL
jgi:isopenicillin N synthase-like dioxygenase